MRSNSKTVWTFETARFRVELNISQDYGYQYDGEDEDGETQAALDNGDFVAFDSDVRVLFNGVEIGADSLGGSVYDVNTVNEFWTAHRSADPMNRNCSLNPHNIGHYFPDMVSEAIRSAREYLADVQSIPLRKAA